MIMVSKGMMHYQDDVILALIQFAMRNIGDFEILNDLSALELEISKVCNLMLRPL